MKTKKFLSIILVVVLAFCVCTAVAWADDPMPESPDTPVTVPNQNSGSGGSGIVVPGGTSDNNIVVVNPNTGMPYSTPEPTINLNAGNAGNAVNDTVPTITKHPTSETVEEGGEAVFLSRADNSFKTVWYLTKDGTTYLASEVGTYFKGVTATGIGTNRLVLSGVTKDLDGWNVEARFDNANGSAWSALAAINIEANPNASPSPTATPLPSNAPAVTATPLPANANQTTGGGTAAQNGAGTGTGGTAVNNSQFGGVNSTVGNSDTTSVGTAGADVLPSSDVTAINTATGSAGTAKNSHIGAYILAVLAGAVIIGSVLVMALYMKGKISLGKFEKFVGNFANEDEMFDNSGEFYNPDDFKDDNGHNNI